MNIVSFGGGTNSTAMIIGMYLHKIPIDLILFADTGGEQPHTYEFIETFNSWLERHGLPQKSVVPSFSLLIRRNTRTERRIGSRQGCPGITRQR
jgi:3'-phosphoadenosine 5'-phosphosulfate sulfotransferase (PAPS reductase)/FAD synthetase